MPIEPPPTTRLEAFTDAVIAIALTIMVLELHKPPGNPFAGPLRERQT